MTISRFTTWALLPLFTAVTQAQVAPNLAIKPAAGGQIQVAWPAGTNLNVLQQAARLGSNTWSDVARVPSIFGTNYGLFLQQSNGSSFYRLANRPGISISSIPDPASVAPPPQPNGYDDLGSLTAFLYSGPNLIQFGVPPGTIVPARAAVVRGRVLQRDNSPLGGVRVAVLNHSEFGYTFTRADGKYDLVVNASSYTLDFQSIGYCPVQRQVMAPIQSYGVVPDVVMLPVDPVATAVTLGPAAPLQVAASSTQTDAAGSRSASVIIPSGTTASLVMADGTTQSINGLTLRVTEVTVGSNGPAAMPATLPPTSEYTYCAEFSADEATAIGAKAIQFSQPLPVYVDNFLKVPVGTLVPVGSYDRDRGVWVPAPNGIVMEVLGSSNGLAQVDLSGQGQPASADQLAANGFTPEELQTLATRYTAGKTLWRSPVPHFSYWDFNFGAAPPDPSKPNRPGDKPKCNDCDNSPPNYGTINYSAQTFSEQIPLLGVPFDLNYNSARVPDYKVDNQITVPVTWQPPAPLTCPIFQDINGKCLIPPHYYDPPADIRVDMDIAGESLNQILPATNTLATIAWDGKDEFGRVVGGTREATITVAYEYLQGAYVGTLYDQLQQYPALFGNYGNASFFEGHAGSTIGVGAKFQQLFTYPDHRQLGFGSWSPTVLHRLDPIGGILYYGDGRIRHVPQQSALDNFLSRLQNVQPVVAAGPDGSFYFFGGVDGNNYRLFRHRPDGNYEMLSQLSTDPGVVTPSGADWSMVDGQPASQVSLQDENIRSMATGPDGSLYISSDFTIARLGPDLIWHVVLGNAAQGATYPPVYEPDGTPAVKASLTSGTGSHPIAVGPDGSVYYTEEWENLNGRNYNLVRKIGTDGLLYTVFGGGGLPVGQPSSYWSSLFGAAAASAPWFRGSSEISALAVGRDGSIYVALSDGQYGGGILRITSAGMIAPFLNGRPVTHVGSIALNPADTNSVALVFGDEGKTGDKTGVLDGGGGAPNALQVGPDGSVYFSDDGSIIWRVNPNGVVERVAGRYTGDGTTPDLPENQGDPLNTYMYAVSALAIAPDGDMAVQLGGGQSLPYVIIPGRTSQHTVALSAETQIASEDASEIYSFDSAGRHLTTVNTLTGALKWSFTYDANSLVSDITDGSGLVTHIQRDGSGNLTGIVGPYGQRTSVTLDANGFLKTVTNPANETTTLSSSTGGLLQSITRPLGDTDHIAYDGTGRATQVTDAIGGGWSLARTDMGVLDNHGYEIDVNCTNSVGDTLGRSMSLAPNGYTYVSYLTGGNLVETDMSEPDGEGAVYGSDRANVLTIMSADPRFGQQAPYVSQYALSLPNGLAYNESTTQTAGLSDRGDPLSLTGLTNTTTVNGKTYTYIYNATNRTFTLTTPQGRMLSRTVDARGRTTRVNLPGAPVADIEYDNYGRPEAVTNTSSIGTAVTTFSYDSLGQLHAITDPLAHEIHFGYDAAGRINQEVLPDGTVVGLAYDGEYHLRSVTPPGRPSHTFQYDAAGNITKYTPPLVGSDDSLSFAYDTERNLTQVHFPDGQVETFKHGVAGRIEQAVLGAGPTLNFQYATNFGSGYMLPVSITSSAGDGTRYDYTGSILTNIAWSGTITGQVSIQFNADLLPASESVDGAAVSYAYDTDGLLTHAGDLTLARDRATGLITGTSLGVVTDQSHYNDVGQITNYTASTNGTQIWSMNMKYDLAGRLTNKVESIGGQTHTYGFAYDQMDRLQQVWFDGALATTYTYDSNGNRLSRNSEGATYDAQDRLLTYGGSSLSWSPKGTLQRRANNGQTTDYTYDVRGALISANLQGGQQISYVTDAKGRRIGKKINGSLQRGWLWDEGGVVAEVDAGSALAARFVYGAAHNTPSYMIKGGNTYRILSDERGSVRLVVSVADGSVAERLDYDEFGRVKSDSNPGFQPFAFAGGLYDPDTGLVRFGVRDYLAETGQWTARDPLLFAATVHSLYAYAENDPVNFTDRLGTQPECRKPKVIDVPTLKELLKEGGKDALKHVVLEHVPGSAPILIIGVGELEAEGTAYVVNGITENRLQDLLEQMSHISPSDANLRSNTTPSLPTDYGPTLLGRLLNYLTR